MNSACTLTETQYMILSKCVLWYEDFGVRSMYMRHGYVIMSHISVQNLITYPCHMFLLLVLKSSYNPYYGRYSVPDSKVHGANMGPTWVLSAPDGHHIVPMNLAIRGNTPRERVYIKQTLELFWGSWILISSLSHQGQILLTDINSYQGICN